MFHRRLGTLSQIKAMLWHFTLSTDVGWASSITGYQPNSGMSCKRFCSSHGQKMSKPSNL